MLSLAPITIDQLDAVVPTVNVMGNNALLSISGGNGGPYVYALNGVANASLINLANGEYSLTATDQSSGCTGQTTFLVDYSPLSATISVNDVEPCDELINLVISASGGSEPLQYALDNSPYSSDSVFVNVASGSHTIHVRDAQGQLFTLPVEFTLPPVVALNTVVIGDSIVATASAGNPPYSYSLDGVSYQSGAVFGNLPTGTYEVYVRDANGCTASVENVLITSGLVEPNLVWGLSVVPNPSAGLFQLRMDNLPGTTLHLELLDVAGRWLKTWSVEPASGQFSTTLDLQTYAEGTYILRLTDGKNWGALRLQVVR